MASDRVSTGKALRNVERVLGHQIGLLQKRSDAGPLPDEDIARLGALVDIYAKLLAIPKLAWSVTGGPVAGSSTYPLESPFDDEELLKYAEDSVEEASAPGPMDEG